MTFWFLSCILIMEGKGMKINNKMIEGFLADCLGYDELMIDEIKENYSGCLIDCLSESEKIDIINYYN